MTHTNRPPPIQIGLSTLLAFTAAVAILFGTLRWLEVPPRASAIVLLVLVVGLLAAIGLVVAIANAGWDSTEERPEEGNTKTQTDKNAEKARKV